MRFVLVQPTPMITRRELASMMAAISPARVITDFERGYAEALVRVAMAYGIEAVNDDTSAIVEVL